MLYELKTIKHDYTLSRKMQKDLLRHNSGFRTPWPLLTILMFLLAILAFQNAHAYNNSINKLKVMQERSRASMTSFDRELTQAYVETTKLTPTDVYSSRADQTINASLEKIRRTFELKKEEALRIELVDKLIFKFSERGDSSSKEALIKTLDDLIQNELGIGEKPRDSELQLLPFLLNASVALRTLPEPIEDGLSFLDSYMQFSTISNPKPVSEYRNSQGYLNEVKSFDSKSENKIETEK